MEESLEDRITAIERALGIDECTDAKAKDFDVAALQTKLTKLGLDRVMKIPLVKLKKLKNLTNKQEKELDAIQDDIEKGLEEWKKYTMELDTFKTEYFSVIGALSERLDEMNRLISLAESESEA
ncbi:hypothetical protein OSTOST_17653 [Ostertagia ostertagi]